MEISIKELLEAAGGLNASTTNETPFEVGKKYLIRTVTMIQVGRLKEVKWNFLVLEDASWIADTGRFNEALKTGQFNEVEPFTADSIVNCGAIIDAQEVLFSLPDTVK